MDETKTFDQLMADGLEASRAEQREAALALYARASAADPDSGVPHFLIASEHASAGDFAQAEVEFATAVLLAPQFALARYQLGLLQFCTERVPLALLTWQPLLALPDGEALPHFVRGFAALAQDAFGDSLHHLRLGLACEPANPALCSDILQLVEAVERLQERSAPAGQEASGEFMLSAYARGLH